MLTFISRMKFLKRFIIFVGVIAIAIFIFVGFFLEDILVNKLKKELKHTFANYYRIDYRSIQTSIGWSGLNIKINQPKFTTDTNLHEFNSKFPTFFFKARTLEINGISIRKLLFTDDIKVNSIDLIKPVLKLIVYKTDSTTIDKKEVKVKDEIKKDPDHLIIIQKITIQKGIWANCRHDNYNDTLFSGTNINASLENVNMTAVKLKTLPYNLGDENNFFFSVAKSQYRPYNSDYSFHLDSLILNDKAKIISAKNITQEANKSKLQISNEETFVKTIVEGKIGSFLLRGYNMEQLIVQKSMVIQSITLGKIDLDMLRNKHKQFDLESEKLLIQEMITGLSFYLKLDSIIVKNSKVHFELLHNKINTPVSFHISNFHAIFTHINTMESTHDTMLLNGYGKFMDVADFSMKASFPDLYSPDHLFSGKIGAMPFSMFNPVLYGFAGIKIASGTIKSIAFKGMCNKYESMGRVTFMYRDLEIDVDKKQDKKSRLAGETRKKAKLISFLGNMALQNNNPRNENEEPETVNFYFKREKYQNHTLLWLGGILDGVKNTLISQNIQDQGKKFMKGKK